MMISIRVLSRAYLHRGFAPTSQRISPLLINWSKPQQFSSNQDKKEPEDLKDTLNDINKKYTEEKERSKEKAAEGAASTSQQQTTVPQGPSFLSKAFQWTKDTTYVVAEGIRSAYDELREGEKESMLKKKFTQAESYKAPKKEPKEGEEEIEEEKPEEPVGPSSLVVVKEGKSAWEQMKERLQDSPLIREILKNSKKVGQAAASTDIGKKAQDVGQNVKDKISDAREFWETSQNPLVYTLSGIWDNVTGETEEGLATAALRRLDAKWSKVT
jgi:hypothetical protein